MEFLHPDVLKQANCRDREVDFFQKDLREESSQEFKVRAKKELVPLCGSCAIKAACLSYALAQGIEFGVWGGLLPSQRYELHRRGVTGMAT